MREMIRRVRPGVIAAILAGAVVFAYLIFKGGFGLAPITSLSPQAQGFVVLAGVDVPQIMSAYEPSPFTMATFAKDPEKMAWIRHGYVVGGAWSLAFAVAMAKFSASLWPIIVSTVVLAGYVVFCEMAVAHGREHGQDMRAGA